MGTEALVDNEEEASRFGERLPKGCPPHDAVATTSQIVYRLTSSDPPTVDDFKSFAALGRTPHPKGDPCSHASCSVTASNAGRQRLIDLSKTAFWKRKRSFIAHLQIDEKSGIMKFSPDRTHIDLWMFADFDPIGAVLKSEETA